MKKRKWLYGILCGFMLMTLALNVANMSVYAYTQEEIDAAKAWLSANGYSPTRAGAEAAYQDYLNGKFGPIGGAEEETQTEVETISVENTTEALTESNTEAEMETEKTVMDTTNEVLTSSEEESASEIITQEVHKQKVNALEEESGSDIVISTEMDGIISSEDDADLMKALKEEATNESHAPTTEWIVGIVIGVVAGVGVAYYLKKEKSNT